MRTARIALTLFVAAALAGSALFTAAPASAHDSLSGSTPGDGESVTVDPGSVVLTFSESLLTVGGTTDGFAVQVVDSEGLHHESGCVTITDATVSAPIALGDAGGYQVIWQVVSSDGHPTSGQYGFDYEPTDLTGAHDGLTQAAVCGEAWAGEPDEPATATPSPADTPAAATTDAAGTAVTETFTATETAGPAGGELQQAGDSLPWPFVVLLVLVGLGVIAAIVVLTLRRSRGGGFGGGGFGSS
ncbi:copper resistance CopC family protein [Herbiconiux liangxiaofengii]|uniref:copper resistance CopC family protein n=1 Tax=Herbiconiux liangxiaofengii TaxID=3342795 RepID=UPI0035BA2302